MRSELTVRPSRAEDFASWFSLFDDVAAEGRWVGAEAPLDPGWGRRHFERALDSEQAVTLLAELDDLLVGVLGVGLFGGCADLGMMVRDGHRGQGVGSALLDACLDWSRAAGAHKVTLTVFPHNARAIALYERYGFTAEGRLARHFRRASGELWDAIPMGLVLDTTSPGSSL